MLTTTDLDTDLGFLHWEAALHARAVQRAAAALRRITGHPDCAPIEAAMSAAERAGTVLAAYALAEYWQACEGLAAATVRLAAVDPAVDASPLSATTH